MDNRIITVQNVEISISKQEYNENFKVVEFDHFKMKAGLHSFVLSVSEWVAKTNAKALDCNPLDLME